MEYIAPDGYVMISSPTETVTHSCSTDDPNGVYFSVETYPADTEIGIQQMQITRTVVDGDMDISIIESTDAELIAYQESCKPTEEII